MAHDSISGKPIVPANGTGRVCFICSEHLFHDEYYDHVDGHLDRIRAKAEEEKLRLIIQGDIDFMDKIGSQSYE